MIIFDAVTKKYGSRKVLNDVGFTVEAGEFIVIMGPSGAGKSTLISLLIGHEKPTSGMITIDGVHIEKMDFTMRQLFRRKIGIVFQDYKLLPKKTVYENVAFAMEVCGAPEYEISQKVPIILDMVGLLPRQEQYPDELSGGEQQRCALARALVHSPNLLIADEPTGNLDEQTSGEIMHILKTINEAGTTVIMTTHNPKLLEYVHHRLFHMEAGALV